MSFNLFFICDSVLIDLPSSLLILPSHLFSILFFAGVLSQGLIYVGRPLCH